MLEVAGEQLLMLHRSEGLPARNAALGEGIENEDVRRAAFGLRREVKLSDEWGIKPGGAPAFDIQRQSFGAAGRERELQLPAECVPIALLRIFPAAEPL